MDITTEPSISNNIKEIGFDEIWHFIEKKVKNSGSLRRWIVVQGELLPGLQAVVTPQPSNDPCFLALTVKHIKNGTFFTDHWDAFASVLTKNRPAAFQKHTIAIEEKQGTTWGV